MYEHKGKVAHELPRDKIYSIILLTLVYSIKALKNNTTRNTSPHIDYAHAPYRWWICFG